MNIVIAHGHAHRLMTNGVVESAPVRITDTGIVIDREFEQHNTDEMDITGGDFALITELLQRLSYVFADGQQRISYMKPSLPKSSGPEVTSY